MDDVFGPLEGMGILGIGCGESIDSLAHFPGRDGAQSSKCLSPQDTEPALHLVQPGSVGGGIVEMDVGMSGQPPAMLGFMGVQVVQNDMQLCVGIEGDDAVHEVQELTATTTRVMAGSHQARGYFQSSKQGCSSMPFILMAESPHGLSIRQTQPPLGTLQRLNGWLLVYTDDDGIFRWIQVQSHDISGLLSKFRISADAPAMTPLKVNAVPTQYPPNVVRRYISQCPGQQSPRPGGVPPQSLSQNPKEAS